MDTIDREKEAAKPAGNQRPDDEMLAIWAVAVEETRALIEGGWR